MMGLLTPDAGEVRVLGHAMPEAQAVAKRDIGSGRLQTRSYDKEGQKHYATDIVADRVVFLGSGGGAGGGGGWRWGRRRWRRRGPSAKGRISTGFRASRRCGWRRPPSDDDIPF